MPCGSNGYGSSCGSRFYGFPCRTGPPQLDADGNVVPQLTTLCGDKVCTTLANFAGAATVGADPLLSPGQLTVNGDATVTGELTVAPVPGGNGGGLAVTYGAATLVQADLYLDQLSAAGPGASLVYRISTSTVAEPNAQGGRLAVIFDSPGGATTATGFRYTSQPPSFYIASGPGAYAEEKNYAAFGTGIIPSTNGEMLLTTTVLPSGANVFQQLVGETGNYVRTSGGSTAAWGPWFSTSYTLV